MIEHFFKKERKNKADKYKYVSVPFLGLYLPKRNNVIKNYVLDPDTKLVK